MRPNSWTWLGQKSFPFSYSQSTRLPDLPPPPPHPLSKSGLKLVCNVNIVYGNLKSENSQNYAQKSQRNCTFMNSASVLWLILCGRKEHIDSAKNECNIPQQKNGLKSYTKWSSPTYQETITQFRKMQVKNVQAVIITLFRCSSVKVTKKRTSK